MVDIYKSEYDVYYLHDYIPDRKRDYYNDVEMTDKILDFKNNDEDALLFFADELMEAIAFLSEEIMPVDVKNLALIAVPPSKVGKYSPMKNCIDELKEWFEEGIIDSEFGCEKGIYNYGNILTRTSDVNTAHKEWPRPTFQEHLESIECSKDNLSSNHMAFFILDDITTTGTTMNACKKILRDHGADDSYICKLAIGGTIGDDYE